MQVIISPISYLLLIMCLLFYLLLPLSTINIYSYWYNNITILYWPYTFVLSTGCWLRARTNRSHIVSTDCELRASNNQSHLLSTDYCLRTSNQFHIFSTDCLKTSNNQFHIWSTDCSLRESNNQFHIWSTDCSLRERNNQFHCLFTGCSLRTSNNQFHCLSTGCSLLSCDSQSMSNVLVVVVGHVLKVTDCTCDLPCFLVLMRLYHVGIDSWINIPSVMSLLHSLVVNVWRWRLT